MSLHLCHCRETRPSFESGHLGVHSTWARKHRVPLTYIFLRENSSWGMWPHRLQTPSLLCLWGFSRQENWSRLPCSPPENLSNTGIRPRSPTLQEDSLPSEPPRNQVYSKCTSRKSYPDSNEIQVIQVQIHSEYTSRKAYPGDKILHSKVIVKCCELIQEVTW